MDFCEGAGENDGPLTTGAPIPVRKFSTFTEKVRRRDFPATSQKGTFLVIPIPNGTWKTMLRLVSTDLGCLIGIFDYGCSTVWKFNNFPDTLILREINFG